MGRPKMGPDQGTVPKGPAASSGPVCVAVVLDVKIDVAIVAVVVEVRVDEPFVNSGRKKDSRKVRAIFPEHVLIISVTGAP